MNRYSAPMSAIVRAFTTGMTTTGIEISTMEISITKRMPAGLKVSD
jgi:hypothetical protein